MELSINKRCSRPFPVEYEKIIQEVAEEVLTHEAFKLNGEVSVSIVDGQEMQRLNNQYRGIDNDTDVLSFPLFERYELKGMEETEGMILGDIVVSIERAAIQAEEYGHSIEREIGFLAAHGMLHLLGYDHVDDEQEKEMFAKQEDVLLKLGLVR